MKYEPSFFYIHIGLFFVMVDLFFATIQKIQAFFLVKKYPELQEDHNKLILGYVFFMGIPFLVMEIGKMATGIPGFNLLFLLHEGNPFTMAFIICLLLEYAFLLYWVWFRGGAEILHRSKLLFVSFHHRSPKAIKVITTLMVTGGILAMLMLWVVSKSIGPLTLP